MVDKSSHFVGAYRRCFDFFRRPQLPHALISSLFKPATHSAQFHLPSNATKFLSPPGINLAASESNFTFAFYQVAE
jgi:hypothetical protein